VRLPQARKEKPRVSAFISADIPKIVALQPDLVLAFSDLQADIVAGLVREGLNVHVFNQRTVVEILAMIRTLGALVGVPARADALVGELVASLDLVRCETAGRDDRPRVYFEEWDDPMISGIAWVSELIEIAGGDDIFPALAGEKLAHNRIVTADQVIHRAPDIIIGSWCGKKFRPEKVAARRASTRFPRSAMAGYTRSSRP
jgi:iron complex transport system substrate-binding protein